MPAVIVDAGPLVAYLKKDDHEVFTLDSDFRIYRKSRRQVIPLIYPE